MSKCCGTCKRWYRGTCMYAYNAYQKCPAIRVYPTCEEDGVDCKLYQRADCPLYEQKDGEKE